MKKIVSIILLVCMCISNINVVAEQNSPETVYNAICDAFGEPSGRTSRDAMVSKYGAGTAADQFMIWDFTDGYMLSLNSSTKPKEMISWMVDPAKDEDYKKLYELLHTYGEGYGVSEAERCLYLKFEVGSSGIVPYVSCTNIEPDQQYIFSSVDELIQTVIENIHPSLNKWMNTVLFSN